MADITLDTVSTIPTNTSLDITIEEDTNSDGTFENSATISLSGGTESNTLSGFDASSGNEYRIIPQFQNTDIESVSSLDSVTISASTGGNSVTDSAVITSSTATTTTSDEVSSTVDNSSITQSTASTLTSSESVSTRDTAIITQANASPLTSTEVLSITDNALITEANASPLTSSENAKIRDNSIITSSSASSLQSSETIAKIEDASITQANVSSLTSTETFPVTDNASITSANSNTLVSTEGIAVSALTTSSNATTLQSDEFSGSLEEITDFAEVVPVESETFTTNESIVEKSNSVNSTAQVLQSDEFTGSTEVLEFANTVFAETETLKSNESLIELAMIQSATSTTVESSIGTKTVVERKSRVTPPDTSINQVRTDENFNSRFVIKRGDTSPSFEYQLLDGDGDSVDITNAEVRIGIVDSRNNTIVEDDSNGDVDVVDAEKGIVRYNWDSSDTQVPGKYLAEWEVEFLDGNIETFPNQSNIRVLIKDDIR